MVIGLVGFDGGLYQITKIIIVGMAFVFGMAIAQVTKLLKVFLELMDAFDFVSLVTSLNGFSPFGEGDNLAWDEIGNRKRKRSMINENREESLGAITN